MNDFVKQSGHMTIWCNYYLTRTSGSITWTWFLINSNKHKTIVKSTDRANSIASQELSVCVLTRGPIFKKS